MRVLNNSTRYEFLTEQFILNQKTANYERLKKTNERIFHYIYNQTDIFYLTHIESTTLYEYIDYHMSNSYEQMTFADIIKDIKHFLFFLKYIKKVNDVPRVNISLQHLARKIV